MLFLAAFAANFLIEFTIMIPRGGFAALLTDFLVKLAAMVLGRRFAAFLPISW